ncbi:hypothetical protein ES707_07127 [subsurface metagenome]
MTSKKKKISVELSRLNIEEGEVMLRRCFYCKGLSNFNLGELSRGGKLVGHVSLDRCQNCGTPAYFAVPDANNRENISDRYPRLEVDPDEELPEEVKVAFREAMKALNEEIWNGCVTMCRRALEEATENLGAEGRDLFTQIDDLETKRKITPELKEWAHEARLGGKLGAHGMKQKKWADQNDAEEVLEFCRWFFRYVYVLPKQLAERKAKVGGENVQQNPQATA